MVDIQIDQAFTDGMVERAITSCADTHFAGDVRQLNQALLQGQCDHCKCVINHLAEQISEYLGKVDKTVKAVFQYEPTTAAQIVQGASAARGAKHNGINLVAWVERKSAALSALIETLESVLTVSLCRIGCVEASVLCLSLDVQMVDDQDVQERRGLGLLVHYAYIYSRPVWQLSEIPERELLVEAPALRDERYDIPEVFDPDLIPESRLIEHAFAVERIPPEERTALEPHLTELKVILIRRMISDQLAYINIAKRWFTVADLADIHRRRIGNGRVGGKSAGMLLAARILNEVADDEIRSCLHVPESYFIGSDVIYIYMTMNGLTYWNDQKYKPEDQIWREYENIQEDFQSGRFPPEILEEFKELLTRVGNQPLIVRSSSQLEDNFGTSFAGKYDSFFCPNQGTPDENLEALTNAVARTYASTLKPEALLYRRSKGLQDYDERMAVLIQVVQGDHFGKYYMPQVSGVAFSRNIYRWSPEIKREDGFARLVWGLGTRAVQRLGDDYSRLVALSHPTLQPDDSAETIRHYSQRYVDLIDLEENVFMTLPIHDVLTPSYPALSMIAQVERDGFLVTPRMRVQVNDVPRLAITFHEFLNRTNFADLLSKILRLLEEHYHATVDMEFTVQLPELRALESLPQFTLLQCRPQSHLMDVQPPLIPEDLPDEDVLFSTSFMVPRGYLPDVRFVLFIKPEAYFALTTLAARNKISQTISKLNTLLEEKSFICIGPGRWGSINVDLGVYVSYADIHNASALVELSGKEIGTGPEPSLGTHFFQDLMEAHIYPLAVFLDNEETIYNRDFFYRSTNSILEYLEVDDEVAGCVWLIDVNENRQGCHVELIMDDEQGRAIAYLKRQPAG